MPTIDPAMVPTKSPGDLFDSLTGGDVTLNVRWLTAADPAFYEVLNRPLADLTVRQLVIAKAVDNLQLRLGHATLFPYVVQPRISSSTQELDVPLNLIWDFHASMPKKWERLRLAKIKRVAGLNGETNGYSGYLRFIFTANVDGSSTEVSIFQADYHIDSNLTYQPLRLTVVEDTEEAVAINSDERETVGGNIIFKTIGIDEVDFRTFLDLLAPPDDLTDSNSDGFYDDPAVYELSDSSAGGDSVTGDFDLLMLSHGTGLLTDSAWNAIPELGADVQSWLTSFNYPFDANANRTSTIGIVIPEGLFKEFNITAPAGDQPTGDDSGLFFPVWINRIERVGTGSQELRFFFATYNVTDSEAGGTPAADPVEFAYLDLSTSNTDNEILAIVPTANLVLEDEDNVEFQQHFGRGHVVLSSLWDGTAATVGDFFSSFDAIVDNPADTEFSQASTRISSFGVSRVPKYTPTIGQSRALLGSTSRRTIPVPPSYNNRYVTELDQGIGNQVDLENGTSITPHAAIDRYGYAGALAHRVIKLTVNADELGSDPTFYDTQILPRLRLLLGRDPVFGDNWYNGTRFMTFNGDSWIG